MLENHRRNMVESTIDSIAKGIIHVIKHTPQSELFLHQCQYYLRLLQISPVTKYDLNQMDETEIEIQKLIIGGRIWGWLDGRTEEIEFQEPMNYELNTNLLIQTAQHMVTKSL